MTGIELTFWALALTVVYVYVGYPLLLAFLVRRFGRAVAGSDIEPAVTLVISAFNEEEVIAQKLENSLEIDYPGEQLEVLVVSDASDDDTDAIVTGFADRGVTLVRMSERGGKTVGLNAAVEAARGEVIVFSDANALYRPDAIRRLVRNFADPTVGAVVGESTYSDCSNDAERSESAYWRYETAIKRLETQIGSVVGGDGAIYAIRRELYEPMSADALSDFVNPLQIVRRGKRCVYEPEAVSVEEAAGSFDKEFRRKVRIVNRAWRAMMSMRSLLNPFRYGLFAVELISHKLLRWLVPLLLAAIFALNILLLVHHPIYVITLGAQIVFYGLGAIGSVLRRRGEIPLIVYIPFYFCLVNLASARGILEAYQGRTYTTWSTARADGQG